jgi:hypothetical protein
MTQKAPKEKMPALLAEMVNRSKNLESLETLKKLSARISVQGVEVIELAHAMVWLEGVINGEKTRIDEIKSQMPDQSGEIKIADPETPPDAAPAAAVGGQPATFVGEVELKKGEEVLQPA